MAELERQLGAWLSRLVRVPSVNPAQAGGDASIAGEQRLADRVAEWFASFGGKVCRQQVLPERSNVYAIWPGQSQRWLGVDVHLDTVGISSMTGDPFSGAIIDDRVHGRGAVDTKATLAIVLCLLEQWRQARRPMPHNLLIAATVDEEVGTHGAPHFTRWLQQQRITLDELLVAEPTMCRPAYAHKGVARMEFAIQGVPAHSSQPHLGKNAVTDAARLVLAFENESQRLGAGSWAPQPGPPTLTVTLINGGAGINVVPDGCQVSIDYRIAPGQKARQICTDLEALAARTCYLPVTARTLYALDPFYQSPDSPLIANMERWSGLDRMTVSFGTNAFAYGGQPTVRQCVVMGPGSIEQAHANEEWVTLEQLDRQARVIRHWWELDS